MNNRISDKDKLDWNNFINSGKKLPNKDIHSNNFKKNSLTKRIDLHGENLIDANKKIEKLIFDCCNNKVNRILVITGKGIHSNNKRNPYVSKDFSILRHSVPEFIKNNPVLMKNIKEFRPADIKDGGEGAFYIYLKI